MDLKEIDLYKKHDQLKNLKKSTYDKLLKSCIQRIKLAASTGELICIFEIPNLLFGSDFPLINVKCCANYIMNKLVKINKNINTIFIEPNIIFIDWRRE
jgi:hypothetical protein